MGVLLRDIMEVHMRLQIAVDIADTDRILQIAGQIHDVIDIFEVGTPVIMNEGMAPVRALKAAFPGMTVLADSKIIDGGGIECEDICRAGADIVTVIALSDDATILEVTETAHRYGRKVMADLICVQDIPGRSRQLISMGVDIIAVHTGVDMQRSGRTPLSDLKELILAVEPDRCAVAGGIRMETLSDYTALNPGIIIAGSALYQAPDIRSAVIEMKKGLVP